MLEFRHPFISQVPSSKPMDFDKLFIGNLSPDARDLLRLATSQRAKLEEALRDDDKNPRHVVGAVDSYLPSIWQVTASMKATKQEAVKLKTKLETKWTSALVSKKKEYVGTVFLFEVAFVLTLRGLMHRDAANLVLERKEDDFVACGKELRVGAGIFEFIEKDLLPRWTSTPETKPPPECVVQVHNALQKMFLADAQRVAIAKAMATKSNPSLLAKLMLGAADKYDSALQSLKNADKETVDALNPALLEELAVSSAYLRAEASYCLAEASWQKSEYAAGLMYAIDSCDRFDKIKASKIYSGAKFVQLLAEARKRAVDREKEYHHDCNNVYFIPAAKEITYPDGSFIITAIPYELPRSDILSFSEIPLAPDLMAAKTTQNFWTMFWAKPMPVTLVQPADKVTGTAPKDDADKNAPVVAAQTTKASPKDVKSRDEDFDIPIASQYKCPLGMDESVFYSLPEDMQKEIYQDHLNSTTGNSGSNNTTTSF